MSRSNGPGGQGQRIDQVDGLRAVAILTVLAHHLGLHLPGWLDWGPLGVRLFFVLSGYFITISLWKLMAANEGRRLGVSLVVFHSRRFIRVLPALYLSLAIGALIGLPEVREAIGFHLSFLSNFYVATVGYWPPAVSHLWSLSVQEQFYLLWPILIFLVPKRYFLAALVVCVGIAFSFRIGSIFGETSSVFRWVMLPAALDSFAAGSLVAWCWVNRREWFERSGILFLGLGSIAIACFAFARTLRYQGDAYQVAFIEIFEAVFLSWLLAGTLAGWPGLIGRVMSSPWLCYVGRISFGIYLYHILVAIVLEPVVRGFLPGEDEFSNVVRVGILAAVSIGVASLSWHFFEKPISRLRPRAATPQPAPEVSPGPAVSLEIDRPKG